MRQSPPSPERQSVQSKPSESKSVEQLREQLAAAWTRKLDAENAYWEKCRELAAETAKAWAIVVDYDKSSIELVPLSDLVHTRSRNPAKNGPIADRVMKFESQEDFSYGRKIIKTRITDGVLDDDAEVETKDWNTLWTNEVGIFLDKVIVCLEKKPSREEAMRFMKEYHQIWAETANGTKDNRSLKDRRWDPSEK